MLDCEAKGKMIYLSLHDGTLVFGSVEVNRAKQRCYCLLKESAPASRHPFIKSTGAVHDLSTKRQFALVCGRD